MTKLTYLGHAGWVIESKNFKCVFDPWSNSSGAFLDCWYPFPDNSNVNFKSILSNLDFVYISHSHEDHLVSQTLDLLDKNTKFLIFKFSKYTTSRRK